MIKRALRKVAVFLVSLPVWWILVSGLHQDAVHLHDLRTPDPSGISSGFFKVIILVFLSMVAQLVLLCYGHRGADGVARAAMSNYMEECDTDA